jgi:hypothetical protein
MTMTKKYNLLRILSLVGLLAASSEATLAASYDTLPRNIRSLIIKQVHSSEVNSSFTGNKSLSHFKLEQNLSAKTLADSNALAKELLEELKSVSPLAFDKLTLGTYEGEAKAKATVQGIGFAYGITNRFTAYVAFPYYKAEVNLGLNQTAPDNKQEIAQLIASETGNQKSHLVAQITAQIPNVTGETIQSLIVNHYGYRPVGKWQGSGMGDMELGTIYRLTDYADKGLALGAGVVLPTGKIEDPDILQDFSFGDGQTDVYFEVMGGMAFLKDRANFDFKIRGTHQFAKDKTYRIPESNDFPIGKEKAVFNEKLGNMIDTTMGFTFFPKNWFNIKTEYLYNKTSEAKYTSSFNNANRILADGTDSSMHSYRIGGEITTVNSYLKGLFPLPFSTGISFEQIFAGKNTYKYSRVDFEVRFYF